MTQKIEIEGVRERSRKKNNEVNASAHTQHLFENILKTKPHQVNGEKA